MKSMHNVPFEKHEMIRFGLIGAGERGRYLLHELLACEGVEVRAIADLRLAHGERAAEQVSAAGQPAAQVFSGADAWQRLLELDLDLVYIATPWDLHAPFA